MEAPRGKGFVYITNEFPAIGDRRHEWAYRDPFPLSDRRFLCSYGGGEARRYRIYLLDAGDNRRLVYEDLMGCYYPLPLRPGRHHRQFHRGSRYAVKVSRSSPENPMGVFLLADVYHGLEPAVRRGGSSNFA